jgi:hypothetical protein
LQEKEFAEKWLKSCSMGRLDVGIEEKKKLQAVYELVKHASQNDKLTKVNANNNEEQMSAKKIKTKS